MKTTSLDQIGSAKDKAAEAVGNFEEVNLFVEELEDVIAPRLAANHNEAMVSDEQEIKLEVEELEDVIAPRLAANHNETMVRDLL